MVLPYLLVAVIFAILCSALWLATGGSIGMAFVVYMLSGALALVAMASVAYFRSQHDED